MKLLGPMDSWMSKNTKSSIAQKKQSLGPEWKARSKDVISSSVQVKNTNNVVMMLKNKYWHSFMLFFGLFAPVSVKDWS